MKNKYKAIDYKKLRDEAIAAMVEFRKMGDNEMANAYLNLAAHIVKIRRVGINSSNGVSMGRLTAPKK